MFTVYYHLGGDAPETVDDFDEEAYPTEAEADAFAAGILAADYQATVCRTEADVAEYVGSFNDDNGEEE